MTLLSLDVIRHDGGTQIRSGTDFALVNEYAARYRERDPFPAIVVFHDGKDYWLADGYHRLEAAKAADLKQIEANVSAGTRRDAILYACGANADHGLKRTNEDKRRAVETLLTDEEWGAKSDRWIAETCRVGNKFVGDVRREVCPNTPALRQGQDGKSYPVKPKAAPVEPDELEDDLPDEAYPDELVEPDEPTKVNAERPVDGGSFDLSRSMVDLIGVCRDTEQRIAKLFDGISPRDQAEFTERAQDTLLRLATAIHARLPVTAKRAEFNRSQFKVVK